MKRDLGRYFGTAAAGLTVLEVGGHHGHTTRVLSGLFGRVVPSCRGCCPARIYRLGEEYVPQESIYRRRKSVSTCIFMEISLDADVDELKVRVRARP